jgi:hypothetical protein
MTIETAMCESDPYASIATLSGGPEDIVGLTVAEGHTRLFVREVCRRWGCSDKDSRIGYADIRTNAPAPDRTAFAWRPGEESFEPLGMSLVPGSTPGQGTLYVLDAVAPARVWRLTIEAGSIQQQEYKPWCADETGVLNHANDIQAIGAGAYVTRFDALGLLPWRSSEWYGLVHMSPGAKPVQYEPGFRGANGIVDLAPDRDALLVSDY